jgi:hypothetical protein
LKNLLGLLLPNHVKLRDQIEGVLDMELIKQQMDNQTFDYRHHGLFVVDTISKLCAPARDSAIAELRQSNDPVTLFKYVAHIILFQFFTLNNQVSKRGIMEMLDLLKLDMANYTIQQMRPYIQQQVVTYEQKKFQELLDAQKETGLDGLEATRLWLGRASRRIKDEATIGGYRTESGLTASAIVNEAFMEMFVWNCEHPFPEVSTYFLWPLF